MSLRTVRKLGRLQGPLLIFGGPYGNLPATRALLAVTEQRGISPLNIICTGDLVAYCAEPEETVRLIREWGIHALMGNCEQSLAERALDCGCGFEQGTTCSALSEDWFRYADRCLSDGNRNWMGELPQMITLELAGRRLAVVHGGVGQINRFLFESTPAVEKQTEFEQLDSDAHGLIAGHCGIPFGQKIGTKVWLNAGVIGMPANDGTPDGWYLLLEPGGDQLRASWHRLNYPAGEARDVMLNAGLTGYADAITEGLWPSEDVLPDIEKAQRGKPIALQPLLL